MSAELVVPSSSLSLAVHVQLMGQAATVALQVQDVGLIFLSAMATSIATMCADASLPAQTALGTTLLTLTIATTIVGIGTVLVREQAGVHAATGMRLFLSTCP